MMLSESEIKKHLSCPEDFIALHLLESTSSTNDYFKNKPKINKVEFCFTEEQTNGRGRLGRTWYSPASTNIMMSCRWILPVNVNNLNGLSSCISLALVDALKKLNINISELRCKWPNDLYYQDKKLAGILIELYTENGKISEAIIGIGLNVNMDSSPLIEKPWTSLQNISGFSQDRNYIAALLINSLYRYLQRFAEKGFLDFQQEWQLYDYLKGKAVTVSIGQKIISGMACGVDLSGHLLVETDFGKIIACFSGEASLIDYG